jgi:hypothetical protein
VNITSWVSVSEYWSECECVNEYWGVSAIECGVRGCKCVCVSG